MEIGCQVQDIITTIGNNEASSTEVSYTLGNSAKEIKFDFRQEFNCNYGPADIKLEGFSDTISSYLDLDTTSNTLTLQKNTNSFIWGE